MTYRIILVLLVIISIVSPALADDWPQWRGPTRDGVWHEQGIIDTFRGPQLTAKWRAPIGAGYNGPTVADGRVFVMDRLTEPNDVERVLCFDARTGKPLWNYAYDCEYEGIQYEAGPRAAVTIDHDHAYAFGAMANLTCLDVTNGKPIWQKDMAKEYRSSVPTWGFAVSPLIYNHLVIVQIGGLDSACMVALDKQTGAEVWRALDDKASYSSPILITQAGKAVLLCWTGGHIAGLNPETGQVYWQIPFAPRRIIMNIADPVHYKNHVFLSAFFDGSILIKLDENALSADIVWQRAGENESKTDALHCCISTPVLMDNHIYGVDSYGELRCLDLATGTRLWESLAAVPKARWANIHIVRQADRFWLFNERGELIICRLDPQGYHEISRAQLIDPTTKQLDQRGGVCWSHPALANQCVYARNDKELICVNLTKE